MTGDGSASGPSAGLTVRSLLVREGSREIVRDLDLAVRPGGRAAISGSSGADVTAVLTTIAGLRRATSGSVLVDGQPLGLNPSPNRVCYLSQDHRLIGTLTAVENLLVSMMAGGEPADRATVQRAEEQLATLALAPATWHNLVEQLSGGQQQRVALGRALIVRPRLLVLDHPTSELDPDSVELVDQVLHEVATQGVSCLIASDDDVMLGSCETRLTLG